MTKTKPLPKNKNSAKTRPYCYQTVSNTGICFFILLFLQHTVDHRNQFNTVVDVQFAVNVLDVILNRMLGNEQPFCNIGVGTTHTEQIDHFPFAVR